MQPQERFERSSHQTKLEGCIQERLSRVGSQSEPVSRGAKACLVDWLTSHPSFIGSLAKPRMDGCTAFTGSDRDRAFDQARKVSLLTKYSHAFAIKVLEHMDRLVNDEVGIIWRTGQPDMPPTDWPFEISGYVYGIPVNRESFSAQRFLYARLPGFWYSPAVTQRRIGFLQDLLSLNSPRWISFESCIQKIRGIRKAEPWCID